MLLRDQQILCLRILAKGETLLDNFIGLHFECEKANPLATPEFLSYRYVSYHHIKPSLIHRNQVNASGKDAGQADRKSSKATRSNLSDALAGMQDAGPLYEATFLDAESPSVMSFEK